MIAATRFSLAAAVILAASALAFAAEPAAAPPDTAAAHVTYVAAMSAYVDAGQDEGLKEGDTLTVEREGRIVATLTVTYLSTHRASCAITGSSGAVVVGDLARYNPGRRAAPATGRAEAPARAPGPGGGGVHGRVGLRYLGVVDRSGGDGGYREPAADLRLTGRRMNGSPVDLDVDLRTRRSTYQTFAGGRQTTQRMRAYALSVSYRFGERDRLTFGRQDAPMLGGAELFDGLLYDYDGPRVGGGVLAGFQPDFQDLSLSTDVHEYGGYFRVHNRPGAGARWEFATGVAGSYAKSTVDREYLFIRAIYLSKRLSMFVTQDVDFNRGWKTDSAGLDPVEPTGTFASFRIHAASWLDLDAGYDDRSNVYLYRDHVTPLTVFDDTHRHGDWAGATFRIGRHVDLSAEARQSRGGSPGPANAYSLNVGAERFTRASLGVRLRATHFSNLESKGNLYALSTGATIATGLHLEVSGGRLDETNVDPSLDRHSAWYGLDVDAAIGRRWYLLLSLERNQGNFETQDQIYAGAMYRF